VEAEVDHRQVGIALRRVAGTAGEGGAGAVQVGGDLVGRPDRLAVGPDRAAQRIDRGVIVEILIELVADAGAALAARIVAVRVDDFRHDVSLLLLFSALVGCVCRRGGAPRQDFGKRPCGRQVFYS
jgi:hypothetical protein